MSAYSQPNLNYQLSLEVCKTPIPKFKKLKKFCCTYQKEAKALDHCIYDKHFPFCEQNTYLYPSSEQKVRYTAPC